MKTMPTSAHAHLPCRRDALETHLQIKQTRHRSRINSRTTPARLGAAPWRLEGQACRNLREPTVDRREQVAGFGAFALAAPETGQAGASRQFTQFRVLPRRDGQLVATELALIPQIGRHFHHVTVSFDEFGHRRVFIDLLGAA